MKQYPVRYGRSRNVVFAIVLPCLSIAPFIFLLQLFKPLDDWLAYLIIFAFLACVIFVALRIVKIIYPSAVLNVGNGEFSLRFTSPYLIRPAGFTLKAADIISFTRGTIDDADYLRFETRTHPRKFQLSARSRSMEDYESFKQAMTEINEMVSAGSSLNL